MTKLNVMQLTFLNHIQRYILNLTVSLGLLMCGLYSTHVSAQTQNVILNIDSTNMIFNSTQSFPFWLKSGQVLKPGEQVASISIIEFKTDSSTGSLLFYQVLNIKGRAVVPTNRAWKIEGVAIATIAGIGTKPSLMNSPAIFTSPGTYQWVVPSGVYSICAEVWGGGGSGVISSSGASGGGSGGGYGYECFNVIPNTSYFVQVGGAGGNSSVGTLISAAGGKQGSLSGNVTGGTSTAKFNITGAPSSGMSGGAGANGGSGGIQSGIGCGNPGRAPGGGGSASAGCSPPNMSGASGQVIIHW